MKHVSNSLEVKHSCSINQNLGTSSRLLGNKLGHLLEDCLQLGREKLGGLEWLADSVIGYRASCL